MVSSPSCFDLFFSFFLGAELLLFVCLFFFLFLEAPGANMTGQLILPKREDKKAAPSLLPALDTQNDQMKGTPATLPVSTTKGTIGWLDCFE